MRNVWIALAAAFFCFPSLVVDAFADGPPNIVTEFDSDLEGWTVIEDGTPSWQPTGGNPDGWMRVDDQTQGDWIWAKAPSRYLGNWSARGLVSVDLRMISGAPSYNVQFQIGGPGGNATFDSGLRPTTNWTTYSAVLSESSWSVTSGTWADLLGNVTEFLIRAEFRSGAESCGIDNVVLLGAFNSIMTYDGPVHLGDDVSSSCNPASPSGTVLSLPFNLPNLPDRAVVSLDAGDVAGGSYIDRVFLNGTELASIPKSLSNECTTFDSHFARLCTPLLVPGSNTLVIETGAVGGNYDDVWLRNIVVATSQPVEDPFEIVSVRSDTTLYQNRIDTALITVVTRSNWGNVNGLTLALTLHPSLGPLMHVGDDYFSLAPGEQHESHFAWQVPDTSYAWEFGADLLLTKDTREEVLRQYVPGVFEATPLEKEIVIQATLHVAGCSVGVPPEFSDCAVQFQRAVPAYSRLYSIGLFEQHSCRVMDLYLHDRPIEGLAVYQAMLPEFGKFLAVEALSWLTGGMADLNFLVGAADLFHSGNEYIRNCASTAFADELVAYGKGRPLSDPDELLDSLAVIMNTAIDSTEVELADLLFVDGVPHIVVLADSSRADADSTGLIMAVINQLDSLVTLTSVTPHVHRFRGSETDNPHSNAVLAIYPQVSRSIHVGLLHTTIADERLYFRYPPIDATDSTVISLPVANNLAQLPLYVDFDGDGTVDDVLYPEAGSAVEEVRTPPPFFAVPSPNPASDGTVISFAIPRRERVIVKAFDLQGRCMGVLFDGSCEAGSHRFVWNEHDAAGRPMSSGVYFLRLESGGQHATRRLIVLR